MSDQPNIANACALLRRLADGEHIQIDGEPYPIAMGEDFSVGHLYVDGYVKTDLTVGQFIRMATKMNIMIPKGLK